MILNRMLIANITRYCNYLERPNNWYKTPVVTLSKMELLGLLMRHYGNSGNYIYEIYKPE